MLTVLAAVIGFCVLLSGLLFSPERALTGSQANTVGEREMVRIIGPDGRSTELPAMIDTGATASSLDTKAAKGLGFDLDHAPKVLVGSALGREERPVVDATVQIAGRTVHTHLNVNSRTSRPTPVLIGRDDLQGAQVAIGRRMLTSPEGHGAPSALRVLLTKAPAMDPLSLTALLPLVALLIVVLRVVVGLNTLGTFSPMLLALAYTQAGLPLGILLTLVMFALGFAAQPLLRRFHLPRVARLGVLIGLVTSGVVGTQLLLKSEGLTESWGASLPVVVTAIITERLWEQWELDGVKSALSGAVVTIGVAVVLALVLLTPLARYVADRVPLELAIACAVWTLVAGMYRGLRLVELLRFRRASRVSEATA